MTVLRSSLLTAPAQSRPSYHLLELTPDLVHLFEGRSDNSAKSLCIKGRHNDEAVLCTDAQTYTIRQVTQSNSLLLCTLDGSQNGALTVRDNVVELLELVPVVARTGHLASLLRPSAYAGEEQEEENDRRRRYTSQQVASVIQASPNELQAGLRQAYVVEMDGYLRMMQPAYLFTALRVLLAHIDKLALSPACVNVGAAVSVLDNAHDMRREAALALLSEWFGSYVDAENVALNEEKVVQFVGLHMLETEASREKVNTDEFIARWSETVGSMLSDKVHVRLLDGHCLTFPEPPAIATKWQPAQIQHFSSSTLSLDVAARFQTLFTVRSQWTADALTPFLRDVAVDVKRRDALLLKFARTSHVQMPVVESKQERRARLARGELHAPTKSIQLYSARLRYG